MFLYEHTNYCISKPKYKRQVNENPRNLGYNNNMKDLVLANRSTIRDIMKIIKILFESIQYILVGNVSHFDLFQNIKHSGEEGKR